MKELNDIVTAKMESMITSGKLEEMLEKQLESTMQDLVKDSLRSYGDFGKEIGDKIKESMATAARNVSIPEYNMFLGQVVERAYKQHLDAEAASHMNDIIGDIFKPVPAESTFSALTEMIKSEWQSDCHEHGHEEIEVMAEEDSQRMEVTIKHPEYDWKTIRFTMYNFGHDGKDTWHIGYIREGDNSLSSPLAKAGVCTENLTDRIYQFYAKSTEFTADTELESIWCSHD